MRVEFRFTGAKDFSKLYKITNESAETSLSELIDGNSNGSTGNTVEYIGTAYVKSYVEKAVSEVRALKEDSLKYLGMCGSVGHEWFEIQDINERIYELTVKLDSYESAYPDKVRLLVTIEDKADETNEQNNNDAYDKSLEELKITLKNFFMPDWQSCTWKYDEQSEALCASLYPLIFKTENMLRGFCNEALSHELGPDWISSFGLEHYKQSYESMKDDFVQRVPEFADVDSVLISTTLETLFDIIMNGEVYENNVVLSRTDYDALLNIREGVKAEAVQNSLKKKRTVKKHLWTDIFKKYFGATASDEQLFTDYRKNRNHVAHNKPLTYRAYEIMEKSFTDMEAMILKAQEEFDKTYPSEEEIQTQEAIDRAEQIPNDYIREAVADQTGVDIKNDDEIYDALEFEVNKVFEKIHDKYYMDECTDVTGMFEVGNITGEQKLANISSNAADEYSLQLTVEFIIDDEMDAESEAVIRCRAVSNGLLQKNVETEVHIVYHNGSGIINDDGWAEATSDSYIESSGSDKFITDVEGLVNDLNPYIKKLQGLLYETTKEGGNPPVADFPCENCGHAGVSVDDSFYPYGKCCYCGYENELHTCTNCGAVYGDGGGKDGLCQSCLNQFEKAMAD